MSHREPSRKRRLSAALDWDAAPLVGEAEVMDALLRAQGYERAPLVRVWGRAGGLVTCRYVWRCRDIGASLTLTVTTRGRKARALAIAAGAAMLTPAGDDQAVAPL